MCENIHDLRHFQHDVKLNVMSDVHKPVVSVLMNV